MKLTKDTTVHGLPSSKRLKHQLHFHPAGSTPCLPAKKRVYPPPPPATDSVCLPAKKRAYAPPQEVPVPMCLPARKRAYVPPPDDTVAVCLPAKKRLYAPPPPETGASPCLPAKKRVCAPPPQETDASPSLAAKKRVHAPPPPPEAAASVSVCLPTNKRVSPPFIPPSVPPSMESDAASVAAVREAKAQESKKGFGAVNPKAARDGKGESLKNVDTRIDPKPGKYQDLMKSCRASTCKDARDEKCKKAIRVVNSKQHKVQVEGLKKYDEAMIAPKEATHQESEKRTEEVAQEVAEEEDDEDGVLCAVCGSTDGDPSDPIVFCDGCDLMVHASCYGNPLAQSIPDGDWFCSLCSTEAKAAIRNKSKPARPNCCLCPGAGRAMKGTTDGRWAHIACALLVPEVFFRDPDGRDGIDCSRVPGHRFTIDCYICNSRIGCALECSQPKCSRGFHVSCGHDAGLCIEYQEAKGRAIVAGFCLEHTKLWEKQQITGKYKIVARGEEMEGKN